MTFTELAERWRTEAETLARYGDDRGAAMLRLTADQLDGAMRDAQAETLTLHEAARESGYSADRLRHMVSGGELPNAGRKGAPRIRRGDLPRKRRNASACDFDADALASTLLHGARP